MSTASDRPSVLNFVLFGLILVAAVFGWTAGHYNLLSGPDGTSQVKRLDHLESLELELSASIKGQARMAQLALDRQQRITELQDQIKQLEQALIEQVSGLE